MQNKSNYEYILFIGKSFKFIIAFIIGNLTDKLNCD